ncbi:hypothetical protein [Microbacterium sp. NPDC087592]|uniref:hypothetical protein n=1 Tax=Microbacterium sp. NPDC087592 TaxID=3364193 RepID=UPI003808FA2E
MTSRWIPPVGLVIVGASLLACSSPAGDPGLEIPVGFELEDLHLPDVWISTPVQGGTDCGTGPLHDCWTVDMLIESDCDGYVLLGFEEYRAEGAVLERYERLAARTSGPGGTETFSWSSEFFNSDVIASISVTKAECVGKI